MSIKISKENICINQIVGQKEDSFTVEGDEIVPDIKPDILSVITTNGNICIYKKEILDGKVKIEGCINSYTLYIADDEKSTVRCINSNLNFTKIIEIENANSQMQLKSECEIKNIGSKILNGRKVNIKADVKINISIYSNENVDVIKDVEDICDMQRLNKGYNINSLLGSGETKVYAKDTIKIDNSENLLEIVKCNLLVNNKENKVSYNKVLVKADANLKIMYLTDEYKINSASIAIPIMGFIDMPNVNEENLCDVNYELKNLSIKPNNIEEHSVYVEAEFEISCFVYENKQMQIIQDLYSPTIDLDYQQQNIKVMQNKQNVKQILNIRKQEIIPEIGENKIYDVDVKTSIISNQVEDGKITYQGEVSLTFLFSTNEQTSISSKNLVEPFEFEISNEDINTNSKIDTNIDTSMQDFVIMNDGNIDIKLDLEFDLDISKMESINIINDVKKSENRNKEKYSIVIYYIKPGDTLWNIAKRFGSTIDEIAKTNNMENEEKLMVGDQLFIPR